MPSSATALLYDPDQYSQTVRAADVESVITKAGKYTAKLQRIDFHQLWMQRSEQSLAQVSRVRIQPDRASIYFLTDFDQAPIFHRGIEMAPGRLVINSLGAEHYRRATGAFRAGSLSLEPDALMRAGQAILGRNILPPRVSRVVRPLASAMAGLLSVHRAASVLAKNSPETISHPEVARAFEDALIRAMIACLGGHDDYTQGRPDRNSGAVMLRFRDALEANTGRPMYLAEICAAVGVSQRVLHMRCIEHLGMGPHRFLWLRRMYQSRRALALANRHDDTVTTIANDHGFSELGRFAAEYRKLFGELPSATLNRTSYEIAAGSLV